MGIIDLYNKGKGQRVAEARLIPKQGTNMVDVENQFQKEFQPGDKPGDPTRFTQKALDFFNKKLKDFVPDRHSTIPFHQYEPGKPYNPPGSVKSGS